MLQLTTQMGKAYCAPAEGAGDVPQNLEITHLPQEGVGDQEYKGYTCQKHTGSLAPEPDPKGACEIW